jgi:hypothetical protein
MRWRLAVGLALWAACSFFAWALPAATAAPVNTPPAISSANAKDEEPTHRVMLLGATIYGAVSTPNAVYDVPWQEPFLLGKGAGELDRNFLQEIFQPVDREEFLKHTSPSQDGLGTQATP